MNRDMRDYKQLMRTLENGYFMTHEEMAQVAEIIKELKVDADRYRWLTRYSSQLFMVTDKQLDEQVDKYYTGRRE